MKTAMLMLLLVSAHSKAEEIVCPAELPASAVTVSHAPTGWTGFVPTNLALNAVGVTLGPLADRATLIGDYRKLTHGAYSVTFSLKAAQKHEPWLMCQYGDSNDIVIAKRLANTVDTCLVLYTPDTFGGKAIKIKCT